ncbi:MAG: hypothetical protein AABW85_00960 [archaeon]
MLGFVLSKLNLLILVFAIFAILSFFTFSLIDLVKVYESRLVLEQLSSKAYSLVSSPSYCFSDSFDLPRSIVVGGDEFFYIVKISKQKVKTVVNGEDQTETIVIFSLIPRKEYLGFVKGNAKEPPSVAASAFRTSSGVRLFSRTYFGEEYKGTVSEPTEDEIIVDPSTKSPFETIEFRKEIISGQEHVYIFPCSGSKGNCEQVKCEVACDAFAENAAGGTCTEQACVADELVATFKC